MRKLLFFVSFLIFVYKISAFGSNLFYADFTLTNGEYGFGAQFPCKVWFNGNTGQMRVDYANPNGTRFMSQYYNYNTKDRYSVCSDGKCTRATWTATQPNFVGDSTTYASVTCQKPDFPGPYACSNYPNCASFLAQPAQPTAIYSLSYFDTTNYKLCLVRWSVAPGNTYGAEWHISNYVTSGFTAAQDPSPNSTYSAVLNLATSPCPAPICKAEIDIALVIDESGSIFAASGWDDVQTFVKNLVGALDMKADGTGARVGLVYFSGLDNCKNNWTIANGGQETTGCSTARNGDCSKCGGRWQQLTTGVITSKTDIIAKVNGNTGAGGYTCIACGIDVGIKTLNVFPKANVQKLIILMTDGAQNRVTGSLSTQGKIAYDMGIKIIAVGTGDYKIEDLQVFATTIYSTKSFAQLSSIINQIITPLCTPIVDDCNFCSGLCSCSANCNCPACNDYNACTVDKCDPRLPPDGTAGICVTTPTSCNDNNVCTQNLCNNSTGCYYTVPTAKAPNQVDTFCKRWICTDPAGYQLTDVGDTACVQPADKCVITYCNTTVGTTVVNGATLTGSCVSINRTASQYPVGTVISYVNSLGQSLTTSGCARPSNALPCEVYSCFNGSCTYSASNCICTKNSDCDDGDGCTTDVCDTNLNKCNRTAIDCWSNLSGGNCKINVNSTQTTATGDLFYANGNTPFPVDANGLPSPNSKARTCDELACYGGVRSTYTCISNSNVTFTCRRATNPCQSSACNDNTCRSLGTWTTNQYNTDCLKSIARTCNDNNVCTSDSCNSTWTGTSCQNSGTCATTTGGSRCLFPSNATNCNDNSVCTTDTCVPGTGAGTGCNYAPRPTPPTNFCFNVGCDPKTGNFSNVDTTKCLPPSDKCNITYCNTTTQQCVSHDKKTLTLGTTITFVDQYGQSQSVVGCFQAAGTGGNCRGYTCDPASGLCIIDSSACGCTTPGQCDDNNGCTIDSCDFPGSGKCINTPIDCWKDQSNSGCVVNQAGVQKTNATGVANYNAGAPDNAFIKATGSNTYTCDQMACYSGIRSTYTCQSLTSSTYQCNRVKAPCAKGGCQDTICTTLGTWSNGQLNTDCSSAVSVTCTPNSCYTSVCNETFVFGSGNARCIQTYNGTNCEDNNACTLNQCDNSTGCIFPNSPNPFGANKTCVGYACDTTTGWQAYDLGISKCTNLPTNPCQITYCNTTSDSCIRLDKGDTAVGKTVDYIDSSGALKSLSGCGNPGDPLLCKSYTCDPTSGQCQAKIDSCRCINDASCSDGDGCTVDTCNIQLNRCERTYVDCFSILSNGTCTQGSTFSADIFTGINLYYGNATVPNNFTAVDSNGLPSPSTGVSRTCGQLGCYNGQPSQYSCFSAVEGSYTCQRISVNCSRNGCQDNICRTNGTWSNGQINSDCGTIYRPFCADNDACTDDYCNSTWVATDPVSLRCIHAPINAAQVCDDGNFCTKDYCDNQDTSGDVCKHSLYDSAYLKKNLCKNVTSVCQTVQCTVNKCVYGEITCIPPTLCIFYTCNATTKGVCKSFPTGLYKIDKCGICGGNGLSCVPNNPGNPKKTSIAVALGVGLGVGLAAAAIIIFILSKKSYDYYSALATETLGTVTTAPTYQGGEHHFDTSGYGGNTN